MVLDNNAAIDELLKKNIQMNPRQEEENILCNLEELPLTTVEGLLDFEKKMNDDSFAILVINTFLCTYLF